jgi:hypothetical protein
MKGSGNLKTEDTDGYVYTDSRGCSVRYRTLT